MNTKNPAVIKAKTSLRSYKIFIRNNLIDEAASIVSGIFKETHKVLLVTDERVFSIYSEIIDKFLERTGFSYRKFIIREGEEQKNIDNVKQIYHDLIDFNVHRNDAIIAFGGGVVGDLTGFAAATFHRGINLIHFPTTIVAQIDSSIGGKTAVNFEGVKNVAGSFYQPHLIMVDPFLLKTLPVRELINGMAELIKYGVVFKKQILNCLKRLSETVTKDNILGMIVKENEFYKLIYECCRIKANVTRRDEYDTGYRNLLNFGHTFGHAIEKTAALIGVNHGMAVSAGMMMAADASILSGYARSNIKEAIGEVYASLKMPYKISSGLFKDHANGPEGKDKNIFPDNNKKREISGMPGSGIIVDRIIDAMQYDKKFSSSRNKFVLLKDINKPFFAYGISESILREAIKNNISGE